MRGSTSLPPQGWPAEKPSKHEDSDLLPCLVSIHHPKEMMPPRISSRNPPLSTVFAKDWERYIKSTTRFGLCTSFPLPVTPRLVDSYRPQSLHLYSVWNTSIPLVAVNLKPPHPSKIRWFHYRVIRILFRQRSSPVHRVSDHPSPAGL